MFANCGYSIIFAAMRYRYMYRESESEFGWLRWMDTHSECAGEGRAGVGRSEFGDLEMEKVFFSVTNSFPKSCPSSQTCFIVPKNWINIAASLCIPKYLCKCYPDRRAPLLFPFCHSTVRPGPISHSYKYFVRNAICHKISKKDLNRLISWLRLSEQQMNEIDKCGRRTENGIGIGIGIGIRWI